MFLLFIIKHSMSPCILCQVHFISFLYVIIILVFLFFFTVNPSWISIPISMLLPHLFVSSSTLPHFALSPSYGTPYDAPSLVPFSIFLSSFHSLTPTQSLIIFYHSSINKTLPTTSDLNIVKDNSSSSNFSSLNLPSYNHIHIHSITLCPP